MVIGSTIIPLSDFLTLSTSIACLSILMFRWMIPIPPSCAKQIAVPDSVTVSIAALRMGIFNLMLLVSIVEVSTSRGRMSDSAGTISRSSKVNASTIGSSNIRASILNRLFFSQIVRMAAVFHEETVIFGVMLNVFGKLIISLSGETGLVLALLDSAVWNVAFTDP